MEPLGPWAAYTPSYNRLTGSAGSYQVNTPNGRGSFGPPIHLSPNGNNGLENTAGSGMQSTNAQLLLQTTHGSVTLTNRELAGHTSMSPAFAPGSFLTQTSASYDPVFSSLFHHPDQKPTSFGPCVTSNPQKNALQHSSAKQNAVESEITNVRENCNSAHQQNSSYFEQQAAGSPSSLPSPPSWVNQPNAQLPSPFGILPHETIGKGMEKGSPICEGDYNVQFTPTQSLNNVNPQLSPAVEFNKSSSNYNKIQVRKPDTLLSPGRTNFPPASSASGSVTFYQHVPATYSNVAVLSSQDSTPTVCGTSYQNDSNKCQQVSGGPDFGSSGKAFSSPSQLSTQYHQPSLDTKLYSEFNTSEHITHTHLSEEPSQSPPVSYTVLNNTGQAVNFARDENSGTCSTNIGSVSAPSLAVEDQHGRCDIGTPQHTVHRRQLNSDSSFRMQQYNSSIVDQGTYGSSASFAKSERKPYSEPLLCISNDSLKQSKSDCGSLPQTHSPVSTHSHPSPLGHNPSPLGHVPSPLGHVSSPLGHVPSPRSHVPSPLGHNLSPVGHNPSPHGHASSPTYPVYNSPVGIVSSASYVHPLSPEVSLQPCSATGERQKLVSHSASNEQSVPPLLGRVSKPETNAQSLMIHTSTPGDVHRQKLNESDSKDSYREGVDVHGRGNQQDRSCHNQNVAAQTKDLAVEAKYSPVYKTNDSERGSTDVSAADTTPIMPTATLSQTPKLLQPQDVSEPTTSLKQGDCFESIPSHSRQLSSDANRDYKASLQQADEIQNTVLLSSDEGTESHTSDNSSHLISKASEEHHYPSTKEALTQNSCSSCVTHSDRNQEEQSAAPSNKPLNEQLCPSGASVESDNAFKQKSSTSQVPDVSSKERQPVMTSAPQASITDNPQVHKSTGNIHQVLEIANSSSETKSVSHEQTDIVDSFNEVNRKVILIDIEDDLECLLENSSVCSPLTTADFPEQDLRVPKQKYFIQNHSFLDGYVKFLNEERGISLTKSRNIEKLAGKEMEQKLRRKQLSKNLDVAGTSSKFSVQGSKDPPVADCFSLSKTEDSEESSCASDATSDMSESEAERSKRKGTDLFSEDYSHEDDQGSERKRQKLEKEEIPEKKKKKKIAKECRGKSIQGPTIRLRCNSGVTSEFSSQCSSLQPSYPSDTQSLNSQNAHEKEQKKRSRSVKEQVITKRKMCEHKEEQTVHLPRREMTPRKAKESSNAKKYINSNTEEFEEDSDEDVDTDPAWTPAAKEPSDDDNVNRRRSRRSRYILTSCKRARHVSPDDTRPGNTEDLKVSKLRGNRTRQNCTRAHSTAVMSQNSHSVNKPDNPIVAANVPVREAIADTDFRSGDFVIMKSDVGMEHPPLWRIDGRTLLQKYENFEQNGKNLYRNISTYTSWNSQNRHIYQQVPVRFVVQNQFETVVELQKNDVGDDHRALVEQSITETAKYYSSFEVYIQTLISQALDTNFLTEVLREHDDYFLSNLKTVDEVTEDRMEHLLRIAKWPNVLRTSVGTWPCFNVIDEPTDGDGEGAMPCVACEHSSATARVQMYGQPYDRTTLEGCPPDPKLASQKDFLLCNVCVSRVDLYNKVAHQKYHMYVECAKRVADKRSSNPTKDSMEILNELLADELWLRELFLTVRSVWAEIDTSDHQP